MGREQQALGGVVVGADDDVVLAGGGQFADELYVAGIAGVQKVARHGEAVGEHGGRGSGFAGIDGDGGEWSRDEGEALGTEFDEVLGEQVATGEVVDADEEISPVLAQEIARIKQTGAPDNVAGYSMPRCVLYEGRWIRHGDWYPDRLTRLFRKTGARFVGGKVHERLELAGGRGVSLRGDLFHYSFKDAADHWARCQKYAQLWAETQYEAGRTFGPFAPWSRSAFRWLRGYWLRGGFLDGPQGWRIARMNAREVFLKHRLLQQMRRT